MRDDQPPGQAAPLAVLARMLEAQQTPLLDGAERARHLDAPHWSGPASEVFAQRRAAHAEDWRTGTEINGAVGDRIAAHQEFATNLRHLWPDIDDAHRAHLRGLFGETHERVAEELHRRAAELDALARLPQPRPVEPPAAPAPARLRIDVIGAVVEREARLGEQVLVGTRVERIRWAV